MKILFFGITRDIVGEGEINFSQNVENVGDLKNLLSKQYPELLKLNSLAVAVNEEYAEDQVKLTPNDLVALIPPVSGG